MNKRLRLQCETQLWSIWQATDGWPWLLIVHGKHPWQSSADWFWGCHFKSFWAKCKTIRRGSLYILCQHRNVQAAVQGALDEDFNGIEGCRSLWIVRTKKNDRGIDGKEKYLGNGEPKEMFTHYYMASYCLFAFDRHMQSHRVDSTPGIINEGW